MCGLNFLVWIRQGGVPRSGSTFIEQYYHLIFQIKLNRFTVHRWTDEKFPVKFSWLETRTFCSYQGNEANVNLFVFICNRNPPFINITVHFTTLCKTTVPFKSRFITVLTRRKRALSTSSSRRGEKLAGSTSDVAGLDLIKGDSTRKRVNFLTG